MEKKIRGDNKGFSLIELIVAVLILGILSGFAVAAFSSVLNARVGAAAQTVKNALKQTRTKAIGLKTEKNLSNNIYELNLDSVYAEFYLSNGNYYVDIKDQTGKVWSNDKICNDNCKLIFSLHTNVATTSVEVGDGSSASSPAYRLYYEKGTGAIKKATMKFPGGETIIPNGYDTLTIKGTNETRKLILVQATGRCYFSDEEESGTPDPE